MMRLFYVKNKQIQKVINLHNFVQSPFFTLYNNIHFCTEVATYSNIFRNFLDQFDEKRLGNGGEFPYKHDTKTTCFLS